jgi:hypothetical protein
MALVEIQNSVNRLVGAEMPKPLQMGCQMIRNVCRMGHGAMYLDGIAFSPPQIKAEPFLETMTFV